MNETQWLSSEDPVAMLTFASQRDVVDGSLCIEGVSDRKLRLFACACCYGVSPDVGRDAEQLVEWNKYPADNAANWARCWAGDQRKPAPAQRAALLREIVGNPFRLSVVLPRDIGTVLDHGTGRGRQRDVVLQDWLTPDVLSLAQAAYEQRGRKCGACCGSGVMGRQVSRTIRDVDAKCPGCGGTGTIDDGTLDPARLAVLSDALEEAGCPAEMECDGCQDGAIRTRIGYMKHKTCDGTGRVPHPLLSHLRSPGPHYRGMWSLDLILGKN